jgi:hypothetical protein
MENSEFGIQNSNVSPGLSSRILNAEFWIPPRLQFAVTNRTRLFWDFDVGRTLVGSGTWELPFGGGKAWGGWQVNGILNVSDGLPFTPVISGDALGQANQSLFDVPDRLDQPGCASAVNRGNPSQYIKLSCFAFPAPNTQVGNAGRNSLIGPGVITAGVSVSKNFPISGLGEGAHLQLRTELFNLTNRANCRAAGEQQTVRREGYAGEFRRPDHDALDRPTAAAARCQTDLVTVLPQ